MYVNWLLIVKNEILKINISMREAFLGVEWRFTVVTCEIFRRNISVLQIRCDTESHNSKT